MKRGLGSEVPAGLASSPVLGSVSTICIQRCSKAPPSGRKIASMVKVLAPTSGRLEKNSAVSEPLNCTAFPTGESTSLGAPSTLGVCPPIFDRLLNFHSVCSCAEAPLAEIAKTPKTTAIAMLHLLITSSPDFCPGPDVDASIAPLQSPPQQKTTKVFRGVLDESADMGSVGRCLGRGAHSDACLRPAGLRGRS